MSKTVYLLGAGAMIDFGGPKTASLTSDCRNIVEESSAKDIITLIEDFYGDAYNFETIIAAIEYLVDCAIANETQGSRTAENTNVIATVLKPKKSLVSLGSDLLWDLYRHLINHVIRNISKYDHTSECCELKSLLKHYFSERNKTGPTKIYSLNYDRLIPELLGNSIYCGTICNQNSCQDRTFCYDMQQFVNADLTYFNLHGSIYLRADSNKLYEVTESPFSQSIGYAIKQKGGSPNETRLFSPIIAGYSKSQRIMSEPFYLGMASFIADCSSCDKMAIIGYSFGDPHVNSIIYNCFVRRVKEPAFEIIDKADKETIEKRIYDNFRICEQTKPDSSILSSGAPHVEIYCDGFESYLRQKCSSYDTD